MKKRATFVWLSFLGLLIFALPACSKKAEKAPAPQPQQAAAAEAQAQKQPSAQTAQATSGAQPDMANGEKIYKKACAACHAAGIAGAPKIGDQNAWKDRIAKGLVSLYHSAIKGFQGSSGVMPPKGGDMSLSNQDVKDAVAYIVQHSKK